MSAASRGPTQSRGSSQPPGVFRRLLPAPTISAILFVTWIMLNESLSAGHVLLATALAVIVPIWSQRYRPDPTMVRNWPAAGRLAVRVLIDIVISNFDVARRVLGPESVLQSRFVWVPLDVQTPHAAVTLASIVTLTPGTLSSEISEDRRHLLVHALHCTDEAALIADIKTRYEAPLLEILG